MTDFKIYMKIPEGFLSKGPWRACLLKRSLYGLKQTPRQWNHKLVSVLKGINLHQSIADPYLFVSSDYQQALAIYVDDILLLGSTEEKTRIIEYSLQNNFEVNFLGVPKFSGAQLLYVQIKKSIFLNYWRNIVCLTANLHLHQCIQVFRQQKAKEGDLRTDKNATSQKLEVSFILLPVQDQI